MPDFMPKSVQRILYILHLNHEEPTLITPKWRNLNFWVIPTTLF